MIFIKKILIIFFVVLFIPIIKLRSFNKVSDKELIIFLDPGHGGFDPGATSDNILEKDINLSVCNYLYELLNNSIFIVKTSRVGDYDLSVDNKNKKRSDIHQRVKMIKDLEPDLVVSIHVNAYPDNSLYGAQTFYTNKNIENNIIAEIIQKNLKYNTNTRRFCKEKNDVYLLNNIDCPAVLVEIGFLSNLQEKSLLINKNYQENLAIILYNSVLEYFEK